MEAGCGVVPCAAHEDSLTALRRCARASSAICRPFPAMRTFKRTAEDTEFLSRKQLALFVERKAKPRRVDDATRRILGLLSGLFN